MGLNSFSEQHHTEKSQGSSKLEKESCLGYTHKRYYGHLSAGEHQSDTDF